MPRFYWRCNDCTSFWSLLSPAIAAVETQQELGITNLPIWFAPASGFLLGAFFLYFLDKKIPHLHLFEKIENAEGPKSNLKKTELLVLAIALHNIPEGLAVGVAFGALAHSMDIGMELESHCTCNWNGNTKCTRRVCSIYATEKTWVK